MARKLEEFLDESVLSKDAPVWGLKEFLYQDEDVASTLPKEHLGNAIRENFNTFINAWQQGKESGDERISGLTRLDLSKNRLNLLGVEEWQELGKALRESSITTLDLSGNKLASLDDDQWEALCEAIKISKVTTLNLSGGSGLSRDASVGPIMEKKWNRLGEALAESLVTSINISGWDFDLKIASPEWTAFFRALQKSHVQQVQSLLSGGERNRVMLISVLQRIRHEGTQYARSDETEAETLAFKQYLDRKNPHVMDWLQLAATDFSAVTDEQFDVLDKLLRQDPEISWLDILGDDLTLFTDEQRDIFVKLLKESPLKTLELDRKHLDKLSEAQWKNLGKALADSSATELFLSKNGLGKPTIQNLIAFFREIKSSKITTVSLTGNNLGALEANDWKMFFESVKETSINHLMLGKTQLSSLNEESFRAFCDGLKDSAIIALNLQGNDLTIPQLIILLTTLKESRVEELRYSTEYLAPDDASALDNILSSNIDRRKGAEALAIQKLNELAVTTNIEDMMKKMDSYKPAPEDTPGQLVASLFDLYQYFAQKTLKSSAHQDRWKHFKSIMNELVGQTSGQEHFPGIDASIMKNFGRGWGPWSKGEYLEKLRVFEKSFNALDSQGGERKKIIQKFNNEFLQDEGLLHPEMYIPKGGAAPK